MHRTPACAHLLSNLGVSITLKVFLQVGLCHVGPALSYAPDQPYYRRPLTFSA
jgi:hypothetical protein